MAVGLVGHYLGAKMGIGVFVNRLLVSLIDELDSKGIEAKVVCSPNALQQAPAIEALRVYTYADATVSYADEIQQLVGC